MEHQAKQLITIALYLNFLYLKIKTKTLIIMIKTHFHAIKIAFFVSKESFARVWEFVKIAFILMMTLLKIIFMIKMKKIENAKLNLN